MKKTAIITLGLLAAVGASAQAPGFKHLKQINLSAQFAAANPLGVGVDSVDVAFDGTDAYVIGYGLGTGTNGTGPAAQGVLKITDVLGAATVGTTALFSTSANEGGWDSKIIFHNGSLYAGFGLGSTQSATVSTGVHKIDTSGNIDVTWNGDGFMSANEATGTTNGTAQIMNAFAIDPRNPVFGGIASPFAVALRARGFIWNFRDNGTYGGRNYLSDVANLGDGPFPPNWITIFRSIQYDASGNLYIHNGQAIMRAERRADVGGGFNENNSAYNNIQALRVLSGSGQAINQAVAYVPGQSGVYESFLAFNDRSVAPGPFAVQVVKGDGTDFSPAVSITGSENLPGGVPGTAFSSDRLVTRTFTAGGKTYLFVVQAGTNDRLSIYEVGAPTVDVTISGTLDLNGYTGPAAVPNFSFVIKQGGNDVETISVPVALDGTYSFTTTASGTVDVLIDGPKWLNKLVTGVDLSGGSATVNATVTNGDVDNDDSVTIFDYIELSNSFDLFSGDPGFVPGADLDGDESITIFDYIILSNNFDLTGDGF